ncbi:E3 ubiquitin-protein ligase rnf8 [Cephus cinctus]|uniref:E3 ubiquitin-protein ligase CHFR n=1 Tax=Cephus cinctus TaxID=211228 RepID=A0AAJ7FH52_CEPCN|nr:E3 ubiquitin-protein ligase rnf8 [Cephus cinctus]
MSKHPHPILLKADSASKTSIIHISKNEFKIGRARGNDKIITDILVSRKHCVFKRTDVGKWTITDTSSSCTMVNGTPIPRNMPQSIKVGDIIQFSLSKEHRYIYTCSAEDNQLSKIKLPELSEKLDTTRLCNTLQKETNCPQELDVPDNKQGNAFDKVNDIMEAELTCSVCSELFVRAMTLNCMHTFCQRCIEAWKKKSNECPVCRTPVTSMIRSLVLDNFIDKMTNSVLTPYETQKKQGT